MPILVDGFETVDGLLRPTGWRTYIGDEIVQSTSHVTQGVYSARVYGSIPVQDAVAMYSIAAWPANTYYIDVYATIGAGTSNFYRFMVWNRVTSQIYAQSSFLPSSTALLDFSFTLASGVSVNELEFRLYNDSGSGNREVELFVDNFRASGEVISLPTKLFELSFNQTISGPDWLPADWLPADWATADYASSGYRFFTDTVFKFPHEEFELTTYPITLRTDTVFKFPHEEFELTFRNSTFFTDTVFKFPHEEYAWTPATGNLWVSGGIFILPHKQFELKINPGNTFIFELIRDYPVSLSLPFNYEILGVSVNSVEGEGRFAIVSNGNVLVQDLPFSPEVTNHVLSGIMVNKGDDLRVVVYMQNGYFRSFKTDFALKRI